MSKKKNERIKSETGHSSISINDAARIIAKRDNISLDEAIKAINNSSIVDKK